MDRWSVHHVSQQLSDLVEPDGTSKENRLIFDPPWIHNVPQGFAQGSGGRVNWDGKLPLHPRWKVAMANDS